MSPAAKKSKRKPRAIPVSLSMTETQHDALIDLGERLEMSTSMLMRTALLHYARRVYDSDDGSAAMGKIVDALREVDDA